MYGFTEGYRNRQEVTEGQLLIGKTTAGLNLE